MAAARLQLVKQRLRQYSSGLQPPPKKKAHQTCKESYESAGVGVRTIGLLGQRRP